MHCCIIHIEIFKISLLILDLFLILRQARLAVLDSSSALRRACVCSSACAATETPTVGMGRTSRTAPGGFVRRENSPVEAPGGAYTPAGSAMGTRIVRMESTRAARSVQVI